ncbi:unnamed protein product, partial [Brenthis ino]
MTGARTFVLNECPQQDSNTRPLAQQVGSLQTEPNVSLKNNFSFVYAKDSLKPIHKAYLREQNPEIPSDISNLQVCYSP